MRRILFLTSVLAVMFSLCYAVASEDCIIDPDLMNKGVTAEPVWNAEAPAISVGAQEVSRHIASVEAITVAETSGASEEEAKIEKNPSQYLEVLKTIPSSEPSIHRGWFEQSIINE